ncbi:MarR family transcriptional regulator [Luteimonas saliphila]|uniref:MarR family transcriptional regulator n=1 Tax=Luteimonas saliphila TaxID=2804919 RepID=UPI00192DB6BF|nr:MarR family transcriptional regulator [Luteimonas saliphila]
MNENMRTYRRELALYALANSTEPMMSAELAEFMCTLAEGEEHAAHCTQGLDAAAVAGVLKRLENEGLVVQGEPKRDKRAGVPRPSWRYALGPAEAKRVTLPEPPPRGSRTATPEPAPNPYDDLSKPQLYALLEAGDAALLELARAQQESLQTLQRTADVCSRIRQRLVAAGLEDRLP